MKKRILIIIVLILAIVSFLFQAKDNKQLNNNDRNKTKEYGCLENNEITSYELRDEKDKQDKAIIIVSDKETLKEKNRFEIDILSATHYHPIELHRCGVYAIRGFNFDYKNFAPLPGFRRDIWFYNYEDREKEIISLAGENELGEPEVYYSYDFRIDSQEQYLVLRQGYLGKPDYSLVIKDLETLEDVFVLTLDELAKKYSVKPANIRLGKWRKDYFWAVLSEGPRVNTYIRIKAKTWKVNVFHTPKDYTGGLASSPTGEYITYTNGPGFIGIDVIAEQIYKEWREQGKKVSLFVYNFFTEEKTTLATIDDPEWDFDAKWLSDTELQYELPIGEKKVYKLN